MRALWSKPAFSWAVVALVLLLTLIATTILLVSEQRAADRNEREEAERVTRVLNSLATMREGQLASTAVQFETGALPQGHVFEAVTEPLQFNQPIAAFTYLAPRDALPAAMRGRGGGASAAGHAYLPLHSSVDGPLGRIDPEGPPGSESELRMIRTLHDARRSSDTEVAGTLRLDDAAGHHIILVHPVHERPGDLAAGGNGAGPGADRAVPPVQGYIAGVMPVEAMIIAAQMVAPEGTALALVSDGRQVVQHGELSDSPASGQLSVADRSWELRLSTPRGATIHVPILVGVAGLLVVLILTAMLVNWSRREREAVELARQRVEERDQALRAEAETNRMFRLLAENLTDMVLITDADGVISYASPAAETMLGWRPREMLGHRFAEYVHPEDEAKNRARVEALEAEPTVETFEHRMLCSDGGYRWVETAARSVDDVDSGQVVELQTTTRDISERKPLQEQLERLAREDALTGLGNRRRFREALEAECARARRHGEKGVVMMIDIDEFKAINDFHGHLAGDTVIQGVADAIGTRIRASDTLARIGGDEFAAILPETEVEQSWTVARDMVASVRAKASSLPVPGVTVSIGLAQFGADTGADPDEVYDRADRAMYHAKSAGRDRIAIDRPDAGSPLTG